LFCFASDDIAMAPGKEGMNAEVFDNL